MSDIDNKSRAFARENHTPGQPVNEMWNAIAQDEAEKMNAEFAEAEKAKTKKKKERIKEVVLSVEEMEEEFKGNIVLYVSFPGSLPKTKQLTPDEKLIVTAGLDAALGKRIGLTKPLFGEFKAYDDFESWRAKVREEFKRFGIPFLGDGMTVLNINRIPDVEEYADKIDALIEEKIGLVTDGYAEAISPEVVATGPLYNARDYPPAEALAQRFKLKRKWMHFGVPDILKEIDKARWEAERKRTADVWREVKANGIVLLRKQVSEMTTRLIEAVSPKEDGTKKKFYASAVTSMSDFFEAFADRNIAGDTELAEEVAKLKQLIDGKDVEKFKTDDTLRAQVQRAGTQIAERLSTMVVDAEARAISFED